MNVLRVGHKKISNYHICPIIFFNLKNIKESYPQIKGGGFFFGGGGRGQQWW